MVRQICCRSKGSSGHNYGLDKMQYTGLQVFSFLVLLIGTGLVVVSIATNYWSFFKYDAGNAGIPLKFPYHEGRRGLYEQCYTPFKADFGDSVKIDTETCKNRYQTLLDNIQDGTLKDIDQEFVPWEVACLALMCGSALLGIIMLLLSPCCCTRCGCCLAVWVLLAALEALGGIAVYVYYQQTDQPTYFNDKSQYRNTVSIVSTGYGYSFWCAVAGSACQLFASIFFAISRCRTHSYSHTI